MAEQNKRSVQICENGKLATEIALSKMLHEGYQQKELKTKDLSDLLKNIPLCDLKGKREAVENYYNKRINSYVYNLVKDIYLIADIENPCSVYFLFKLNEK